MAQGAGATSRKIEQLLASRDVACARALAFAALAHFGRDPVLHNQLLACEKSDGDRLEAAFSLIAEMGAAPSSIHHTTRVSGHAREGRLAMAARALEAACAAGVADVAPCFGAYLDGLARSNRFDEARAVLARMKRERIVPTGASYSALISQLGRAGRTQEAAALFASMPAAGAEPNLIVCNAMLDAYRRARQPSRALELLGRMHRAGPTPNARSVSSVVGACAQAKQFADAWRCYQQMRAAGIDGDAVLHTVVVDCLIRANDPKLLWSFFETLEADHIGGDALLANRLLAAVQHDATSERVERVWQWVQTQHIRRDAFTYNTYLAHLAKAGRAGDAVAVVAAMGKAGIEPDHITCNTLINALARDQQFEAALQLMDQAAPPQAKASAVAWGALLEAALKAGRPQFVVDLRTRIMRTPGALDASNLGAIACALASCGQAQQAVDTLFPSGYAAAQVDVIGISRAVHALVEVGDFARALSLFSLARNSGIELGEAACSALADGYYKQGAFALGAEALTHPDLPAFAKVGRSELLRKAKRYEQAAQLCDEIEADPQSSAEARASARVVAAYCAFHRDDEPELTRLLANEPKGEHGAWARWLCLRVYADRLQIQPQQAANLLRQALHTGRQKSSTADILGALQILQQRGESNR